MKVILRGYGTNMTNQQRQVARSQAQDMVIARGTGRPPIAPRDVFVQSGPRGILVNWRLGAGYTADIAGFRIYKDDENSHFADILDPNTKQHFIEATSGSTPPVTNIFVSAINSLGVESPKVQAQSQALTEAGAPSMPSTPSTYNNSFGSCFSGNTKLRTKRGVKRFDELTLEDQVRSRRGWREIAKILLHDYEGPMLDMGRGELVTPTHRIWVPLQKGWLRASDLFGAGQRFSGKVFNLALVCTTEEDDEHCYQLANNRFAHNVRKV